MRLCSALCALLMVGCVGQLGGANGSGGGDGGGDSEADPDTTTDEAPGCPSLVEEVTAATPTIMLLVDRSGTMNQGFGGDSRWEAIYQTLMDPSVGVVKSYQDRVQFGLALYTGQDANPTCPIIHQVAPQMANFQAIDTEFAAQEPLEDTPTGESLDVISAAMQAQASSGPKAIVIATDGEPDTCADPDPDGQPAAKALAVAAAARAFDRGIEVFVISVGGDVSDGHLQEMANAGVGLDPQDSKKAPYYRALTSIQLEDAFSGIVDGVRGCAFELDGPVPDASTGEVTLDGVPLQMGVGWQLAGNQTIELIGSACDTILSGGNHSVEAIFACTGDDYCVEIDEGECDPGGGGGGGGNGDGGPIVQ